jgi:hypothetical protein
MHRAQLDEIDAQYGRLVPFEVRVSEVGLNTQAIGATASLATRSRVPSRIATIISLFQFGQRTGNPVFSDTYADVVAEKILEQCPSAHVTGLMSLRESTNYYTASGEYVTVRGFCVVD